MNIITKSMLCACAALAIGMPSLSHAGQPHMEAAIQHLEAAKAALQDAEANKGGWRVTAIKSINEAIAQVQSGKAAGKENGGGKKKK